MAGIIIGNRTRRKGFSEESRQHLDHFWELVDEILNAVLFVLIGLELVLMPITLTSIGIALVLVAVILLSRLALIGLPLSLLRRWYTFRPGTTRVLTWGGLRGGISVALALAIPEGDFREPLVVTTYIIVLFSILVQGLSIGKLVTAVVGDRSHSGESNDKH